ncbi:hypothetical protein AU156_gp121 [Edwardsiella phage PEi20]|uniref:Uncharacterized protein n=1 Tax=Edwardsiella phage PEi20 TaxID=1608310 RepID=A0A0B6VTN9_9CAUD|nr:hypothetical protein AU156_gp121 [Edwardsiella phage PEi20]BAQ22771.1 conserved hypothetical protein [Edwardsiella phage PEi20]
MSTVAGLMDFQEKVNKICNEYLKYLEEDLEACKEEGEEDYADQRLRQIEEMMAFADKVSKESWSLTPFYP